MSFRQKRKNSAHDLGKTKKMTKAAAKHAPSFLFKFPRSDAGSGSGSAGRRGGRAAPTLQTGCGQRRVPAPRQALLHPAAAARGAALPATEEPPSPSPAAWPCPHQAQPSPSVLLQGVALGARTTKCLQPANPTGPRHSAASPEAALLG